MNGYGRRRCQYFLPGKGEEILENSRRARAREQQRGLMCQKRGEDVTAGSRHLTLAILPPN
jgi:hypothetical protein